MTKGVMFWIVACVVSIMLVLNVDTTLIMVAMAVIMGCSLCSALLKNFANQMLTSYGLGAEYDPAPPAQVSSDAIPKSLPINQRFRVHITGGGLFKEPVTSSWMTYEDALVIYNRILEGMRADQIISFGESNTLLQSIQCSLIVKVSLDEGSRSL